MNYLLTEFPDAKLYYMMATERTRDSNLLDDLVQEAVIAVWQAKQSKPGKSQQYYNAVARKRIMRVNTTQLYLDSPPETCGEWMPRRKENCARRENHPGNHLPKESLKKTSDTCRRTNASHDVLRRNPASLDQMNGWCRDDT
jgi:hypothetical protein